MFNNNNNIILLYKISYTRDYVFSTLTIIYLYSISSMRLCCDVLIRIRNGSWPVPSGSRFPTELHTQNDNQFVTDVDYDGETYHTRRVFAEFVQMKIINVLFRFRRDRAGYRQQIMFVHNYTGRYFYPRSMDYICLH